MRVTARQERAVRTRRALLRSAAEVFDRCGFTQSKLTDMSAGAGTSVGALHFHFENKAAVAEAVETAAAETLRRAARVVHRGSAHPLQSLIDMSHGLLRLLRQDVVARAGFQLDSDSTRTGRQDLVNEWQRCVERLLVEAESRGALRTQVPLPVSICAIMGVTTGLAMLLKQSEEEHARLALTGFWHMFLAGAAVPELFGTLEPAGVRASVDRAVEVSADSEREGQADALLLPGAALESAAGR